MNPRIFTLLVTALAFTLTSAGAQVIIHESFDAPNGTLVTDLVPNPNQTSNSWEHIGLTVGYGVPSVLNNTLEMQTDTGAAININSNGDYLKPTTLTLSANLSVGTVGAGANRGVGLGFFSTLDHDHANQGFVGLLLNSDGTLALFNNSTVESSTGYTIGSFDASAFHSISLTIDTVTGGLTNVRLSDANGTQSYNFTTNLFTDGRTNYAGVLVTAPGGNQFGYANNFNLSPIPEPQTFLLIGGGALFFLIRNRRVRRA